MCLSSRRWVLKKKPTIPTPLCHIDLVFPFNLLFIFYLHPHPLVTTASHRCQSSTLPVGAVQNSSHFFVASHHIPPQSTVHALLAGADEQIPWQTFFRHAGKSGRKVLFSPFRTLCARILPYTDAVRHFPNSAVVGAVEAENGLLSHPPSILCSAGRSLWVTCLLDGTCH